MTSDNPLEDGMRRCSVDRSTYHVQAGLYGALLDDSSIKLHFSISDLGSVAYNIAFLQ